MPQLPSVFDSYPIATVLDGSGNGTISFQPNGSTVSISRLFVQVSTSVQQATVTLYKGSLNAANAIGTVVSGSTGGLASGQIFVTDGQTLYVQWTGGDAGATATATFSGKQVPFSSVGNDSITWSDPIAASDGTLVFPAIKSNNYVTGSTGWIVRRDGTFELSGGTFRGEVDVTSADGSAVLIIPNAGGTIDFVPKTIAGVTVNANGSIYSSVAPYAFGRKGFLNVSSPDITDSSGRSVPVSFQLAGASSDGTPYPGFATVNGLMELTGDMQVHGTLLVNTNAIFQGTIVVNGHDLGKGFIVGASDVSNSLAVTGPNEATVLSTGSLSWPANRAFEVRHSAQGQLSAALTNNILAFSIKASGPGGTLIRTMGRAPLTSTLATGITQNRIFTTGGSALTRQLVLTMTVPTGANGTHVGSADFPREFNIYDIGSAADYPNAPVLT